MGDIRNKLLAPAVSAPLGLAAWARRRRVSLLWAACLAGTAATFALIAAGFRADALTLVWTWTLVAGWSADVASHRADLRRARRLAAMRDDGRRP